ncbi:MAG: RHS repeat-associated core domain-containing protein, partial [bacterium]|nr:RHS repeat-associated core domain-containing protein [bacterium]
AQGEDPTQTISYAYDPRDRLLTEDGLTRSWDENGNLTSTTGPQGATHTWDFENRLVRSELVDGTVIEHEYDPDGVRLSTRVTPSAGPPQVTRYLVDPSHSLSSAGRGIALSQVVAETDQDGFLTAYYVRGDDLLATLRPSGNRFFHADGLGSIRFLTDETGAVTDRYDFEAFGPVVDHQGADPNAYLFAGEQLDPNSGFYYLRARWLSVSHDRFLSQDPFAGLIADPMSLHRYLYARADPQTFVDPSGRYTLGQAMAVGAIIGGLVGGVIGAIYGKSQTGSVLTLGSLKYILAGIVGGAAAGAMIGAALYLAPSGLWTILKRGIRQLYTKLNNRKGHTKTAIALLAGFALGLGAGLLDPDLFVGITAGASTAFLIVNDILVRGALWSKHDIAKVVGPLFLQYHKAFLKNRLQAGTFIALAFSFGFVTGYTAGAAIRHGFDLLAVNR